MKKGREWMRNRKADKGLNSARKEGANFPIKKPEVDNSMIRDL